MFQTTNQLFFFTINCLGKVGFFFLLGLNDCLWQLVRYRDCCSIDVKFPTSSEDYPENQVKNEIETLSLKLPQQCENGCWSEVLQGAVPL